MATTAAAEDAMALYDACWFHRCVLLPPPPPPPAPAPAQVHPVSTSPTAGLRHRRTRSDDAAAAFPQGLEPLKLPNNNRAARLETILSGKDGMEAAPQPQAEPRRLSAVVASRRRRRRQRRGRSMSELEFEELKGLQDLGFTFSDAEVDAELASIVPGLRRKRSSEETTQQPVFLASVASSSSAPVQPAAAAAIPDNAASAPRRPYLSEAWDDEEEEVRAMLRNWRIPAPGDGADLKHHLLVWAHTVASAVR